MTLFRDNSSNAVIRTGIILLNSFPIKVLEKPPGAGMYAGSSKILSRTKTGNRPAILREI